MEAIGYQILNFDAGLAFSYAKRSWQTKSGVVDVGQTLTTSRINRQGAFPVCHDCYSWKEEGGHRKTAVMIPAAVD
jgi:hypothetical protein